MSSFNDRYIKGAKRTYSQAFGDGSYKPVYQKPYYNPPMKNIGRGLPKYLKGVSYKGSSKFVGLMPGELKGMDTDISVGGTGIINTTGTNVNIAPLNLVQMGSGSWNRVGRKIYPKSVRLTGIIGCEMIQTAGELEGNSVRFLLVWDKQPSGAVPTFDTIFGVTSQTGSETTSVWDPPKYDNMDRFQILKDWREDFVATTSMLADGDKALQYRNMDVYLPLPSYETVFSGQSNPMTIADVSSGALYFIARTANNNLLTSVVRLVANARLRYADN